MTQYSIVTDLNRCVGCLACSVACKVVNDVPVGNYWNKVLRVGPNPVDGGSGHFPDVEMYYLPMQCQHCEEPACVSVCPTNASHKLEDGTVQIDKSKCIGCQFCAMACPYNVRYLNEEEKVVEKCTLCEQKVAQGELPHCVTMCGGRARFFGDLDQGIEGFLAPGDYESLDGSKDYDAVHASRVTLKEIAEPYGQDEVHRVPDVGNRPSLVYILRGRSWKA